MATEIASPSSPRRSLWVVAAIVAAIIIIAELVGAVVGGVGPFSKKQVWSAVFVNNNQIFFGRIKSSNSNELDLTNVYYLQSTQPPQGTQAGGGTAPPALTINSLVGAQIQCPKDEVMINRADILYSQTLQDSSFVVSRLNALAQTPQNCFQPPVASATPAPGAAPAVPVSPGPSPTATPTR